MNTKIGKKIRTLREQKGFSQEAMADKLSISRSAYSRIETGETSGWVHHIEDICKELDIKPEELFLGPESLEQTNNDNASAVQNYTNKDTHITINQISEKLIEQYEKRIEELTKRIQELESRK